MRRRLSLARAEAAWPAANSVVTTSRPVAQRHPIRPSNVFCLSLIDRLVRKVIRARSNAELRQSLRFLKNNCRHVMWLTSSASGMRAGTLECRLRYWWFSRRCCLIRRSRPSLSLTDPVVQSLYHSQHKLNWAYTYISLLTRRCGVSPLG